MTHVGPQRHKKKVLKLSARMCIVILDGFRNPKIKKYLNQSSSGPALNICKMMVQTTQCM